MELGHLDDAALKIPVDAPFWQHVRGRRFGEIGMTSDASATGVGSCGDKIRFDLMILEDTITEVRCVPDGCVYTVACASAMAELSQGHTIDQALRVQPEDVARELGSLPDDHTHCARLAVNTFGEAVSDYYRRQETRRNIAKHQQIEI